MAERTVDGGEDRMNALAMTDIRLARTGPIIAGGLCAAAMIAAFILALDGVDGLVVALFLSPPLLALIGLFLPWPSRGRPDQEEDDE